MTAWKPNPMAMITARGAAVTEAKPFTPHAHGTRGSALFPIIWNPAGNIHPRKKDIGKSKVTVMMYLKKVEQPVK